MKKPKQRPRVDEQRCKGCMLCVGVCPKKILAPSEGVNKKGQKYVVVTDPDKCTGCGMCMIICPDCGIRIEEEKK